ncbi:MAG: hypothetical protein ACREIH_01915 [Nitrospiraceae bacterium]
MILGGPLYKKVLGHLLEARLNREIGTTVEARELVKRVAKI